MDGQSIIFIAHDVARGLANVADVAFSFFILISHFIHLIGGFAQIALRIGQEPEAGDADFLLNLNPGSLEVIANAKLEPSLKDAKPGSHYQFERVGYFFADPIDSKPGVPVFNRTVSLKDSWAKEAVRK